MPAALVPKHSTLPLAELVIYELHVRGFTARYPALRVQLRFTDRLSKLVDEHIDERPLFERNLFTHWNGNPRDNVRGWNGPDYQRISGDCISSADGSTVRCPGAPAAKSGGPWRSRYSVLA